MCLGIFLGQPARRVDPVQEVIGNIEGEIQPLAVVLYIAGEREVAADRWSA
jgi:hypothetical protein